MTNVKQSFSDSQDHITIKNFQLACKVGCTKEERAFPQILSMNIAFFLPLKPAATKDDLFLSVDYAKLIDEMKKYLATKEFLLIETIAEETAQLILGHKNIDAVSVEVSKKVFPDVGEISAYVWRDQSR